MHDPHHVKLLVVDDDPDDQYIILDTLAEIKEPRYVVTAVGSPLAALAKFAENSYDAVLCDYRLGGVTGVDFIKSVRAAGIDTPIILLTGVADDRIDALALEAGASDFVPKESMTALVLDRAVRYARAHASRQRLIQAVLKSTVSAVAVVDEERRVTLWNPRFDEFAQEFADPDSADRFERLARHALDATRGDIAIGDRVVEPFNTVLPDGNTVLVLHDVTARVTELRERAEAERRIRHIALHDNLTGLPNRAGFNEQFDADLASDQAAGASIALLSLDLNRFKEINDIHGHATGDQLLRGAAQRMKELLGDNEYAARLGGDEFVIVLRRAAREQVVEHARRIAAALARPQHIDGKIVHAGVGIGIAYYPDNGTTRETLLANADIAMYRAKSTNMDSICTFDAQMDLMLRERRMIAAELATAIPGGEIELYVQPQVLLDGRALVGYEVLARWNNRLRGPVSPAVFIPVAEETGLIHQLDQWILRRACETVAKWRTPVKIAVNVSAPEICHPDFLALLHGNLLETGLPPKQLEIEITESVFLNDTERALHVMRQIKSLGVSVALDDFGTGYSSLSLLNTFPFDKLKIDKSFVSSLGQSRRADDICRAILGLGRALDLPVLAEGVETEAQAQFLLAEGCTAMQGYLISRPVPIARASEDGGVVEESHARVAGARA